ncbi:MAG: citrate transporter [Chloroflexi bacterium RBG_13_53_26]|jgi:Na+/H+ antiporter NhaD/arsenite permease-like protein|nr:MAG: citrate transporter [Chloroflexi bacterium RBG_13_53_26]
MSIEQILAILIFVVMFIAIMSGKVHRFIPALIGAGFTIILILALVDSGPKALWLVLRLEDFIHPSWWYHIGLAESHGASVNGGPEIGGVNWQTIVFIGGMMIMVEGLGAAGFFRWLCLFVARLVNYRVVPILVTFMLLAGFLSMFIDSITVLLFLAVVTIELARLLKFDPVPIIIAEIFAANVGGSATMSGDPPNIIIGTALGYTFTDFLTNTGPIAWIGMIVTLGLFYLFFRNILSQRPAEASNGQPNPYPQPREAITDPRQFKISTAIFIAVVILLVTHAQSGLSVALIGVIAAALTLVTAPQHISQIIKGLDWRTLLFFLGLFITVGGLEATGVLVKLADLIADASGGDIIIVIPFILWISAFSSAIVDNIPFAATMVPVIKSLSATQGLNLHTMAWTLALGTDIGGNATPIGASANVVGTAIAEKEGYPITWGRFCKYAIPATLLAVALCNIYLIIRYA